MKRTTATLTATTLLAAPATVAVLALAAPAAHADVDRLGRCGGGTYDLSADREDGRYEVSVDVDGVKPGSRWKIVVRHEGRVVADVVRRADRTGDVDDVERTVRGTTGDERFSFSAKRVGTRTACGSSVRVA
ncbi:hypothetical protein [Nocardioides litoris]|uniref:hypothetical protein n=1 Tax=Nocardioides litoris TaxID=1926648 RepID=UPI00111D9A4A|nr:hypothetical protein [Nocardioides litoris]